MLAIELIGVPFDGYGRQGHQARAAAALRDAGLGASFGSRQIVAGPDVDLPAFNPGRAPGSGLMNEAAMLAMVDAVHGRVSAALAAGRFPLVYGGDCTALLGAVPALRSATGDKAGLVFVDGHEDTTPLDVSPDGEGASAELGLLLGLTGRAAAPSAVGCPPCGPKRWRSSASATGSSAGNSTSRHWPTGRACSCGRTTGSPSARRPSPGRRSPTLAVRPPAGGGCTPTSTCCLRPSSPPSGCRAMWTRRVASGGQR